MRVSRATGVLVLVLGCGEAPQVEVVTRLVPASVAAPATATSEEEAGTVEEARARRIPRADAPPLPLAEEEGAASRSLAGVFAELRGLAPESGPIESAPRSPPRTVEEFAMLVDALTAAPLADIDPIAAALADTPATLWPAVDARLRQERKARKADYKALLQAIGGDVPNRYGHFELAWKKQHGYTVKLSEDWYTDLLALPPGKVGKSLRGIYRDCVLTAALLRAAAAIGRDPERTEAVVEGLLAAAYVHEGTFRDEVGRAIRRLGEPAIPGLLRRSVAPSLPADEKEAAEVKASVAWRTAEYARVQLDRMDRLHPRKAIAAVGDDPRLLAELLAAYGVVKLEDAAAPILEHVDASIPRVRAAAREAFLAYVSGPPPRPERHTLRLSGGKVSDGPLRLTYRDFARLAIRERVTAEDPALLEPECRAITEDGQRDRVCEAQAMRLAEGYFARLEQRRRTREQAAVDEALAQTDRAATVASLDALLADNPELPMRDQLVPAYEAAADEAEAAGDHVRAAALLRKSGALLADLDGSRAARLRLRALLIEAEIEGVSAQGRAMLLATAQAEAPDSPAVVAALGRAAGRPATAEDAAIARRGGLGALLILSGLLLLLGLGHLLRGATRRRALA